MSHIIHIHTIYRLFAFFLCVHFVCNHILYGIQDPFCLHKRVGMTVAHRVCTVFSFGNHNILCAGTEEMQHARSRTPSWNLHLLRTNMLPKKIRFFFGGVDLV